MILTLLCIELNHLDSKLSLSQFSCELVALLIGCVPGFLEPLCRFAFLLQLPLQGLLPGCVVVLSSCTCEVVPLARQPLPGYSELLRHCGDSLLIFSVQGCPLDRLHS